MAAARALAEKAADWGLGTSARFAVKADREIGGEYRARFGLVLVGAAPLNEWAAKSCDGKRYSQILQIMVGLLRGVGGVELPIGGVTVTTDATPPPTFQNLTRAWKPMTSAPLFGWLQSLYPRWRHLR